MRPAPHPRPSTSTAEMGEKDEPCPPPQTPEPPQPGPPPTPLPSSRDLRCPHPLSTLSPLTVSLRGESPPSARSGPHLLSASRRRWRLRQLQRGPPPRPRAATRKRKPLPHTPRARSAAFGVRPVTSPPPFPPPRGCPQRRRSRRPQIPPPIPPATNGQRGRFPFRRAALYRPATGRGGRGGGAHGGEAFPQAFAAGSPEGRGHGAVPVKEAPRVTAAAERKLRSSVGERDGRRDGASPPLPLFFFLFSFPFRSCQHGPNLGESRGPR